MKSRAVLAYSSGCSTFDTGTSLIYNCWMDSSRVIGGSKGIRGKARMPAFASKSIPSSLVVHRFLDVIRNLFSSVMGHVLSVESDKLRIRII